MKPNIKFFLKKLNKDIFAISSISFAVLFFLELVKPKFVIAYINLNYVLLVVLLAGILVIFSDDETKKENLNEEEKHIANQEKVGFFTLLFLSIAAFAFIMIFTWDLGMWGFLISFTGGVVVFLLELALR